jgi:hypothetical protein
MTFIDIPFSIGYIPDSYSDKSKAGLRVKIIAKKVLYGKKHFYYVTTEEDTSQRKAFYIESHLLVPEHVVVNLQQIKDFINS